MALNYSFTLFIFSGVLFYFYIKNKIKNRSLLEKTKWLNALIGSASEIVIATNQDGKIIMFNSAAEKMTGYTSEEVIDKEASLIFHDQQVKFETLVEKAKSGIPDVFEWTFVRKNGENFFVRLCITAIFDQKGEVIGYLEIAEDLSIYKQMLSTIEQQRVRMVESAKMSQLGEMASSIAHEINTPLAVITGKASLLIDDLRLEKIDIAKSISQLEKIEKTANQIAKIVKGLKTFSRNSERDPLEEGYLANIIESTLDLCHDRLEKSAISLRVSIPDDVLIFARASELSQVILNLVSNAADAVQNLPEKWIEIKAIKSEHKITIQITDSGNGIATSVVEKMMQPFFSTKEVGKGTGLGLSISKGIIESHNGNFYYDGTSEKTRFVIELPVKETQNDRASA